jgi:hypothetical protein
MTQLDIFGKHEELPSGEDKVPDRVDSDIVEAIWRVYPRKEGKGAARAAITKALKTNKIKAGDLLAAVTEYGDAVKKWPVTDLCYVPYCATWINSERWADDRSLWKRKPRQGGRAGFA